MKSERFEAMGRGYEGLRPSHPDPDILTAAATYAAMREGIKPDSFLLKIGPRMVKRHSTLFPVNLVYGSQARRVHYKQFHPPVLLDEYEWRAKVSQALGRSRVLAKHVNKIDLSGACGVCAHTCGR